MIKNRYLYMVLLLSIVAQTIFAQYNDPNFGKPASGFGSDRTHQVGVISSLSSGLYLVVCGNAQSKFTKR